MCLCTFLTRLEPKQQYLHLFKISFAAAHNLFNHLYERTSLKKKILNVPFIFFQLAWLLPHLSNQLKSMILSKKRNYELVVHQNTIYNNSTVNITFSLILSLRLCCQNMYIKSPIDKMYPVKKNPSGEHHKEQCLNWQMYKHIYEVLNLKKKCMKALYMYVRNRKWRKATAQTI